MSFWQRLKDFFFHKKQPTAVPAPQVSVGTPTEQTEVKPLPSSAAATVSPNPTENFLGGGKLPPVQWSDKPIDTNYHYADGFNILGSGHPVRNTLSAGSYSFTFSLPKDGEFQVNIGEIPGTEDGLVSLFVVDVNTGNSDIPSSGPFNIRTTVVHGSGKAGAKTLVVTTNRTNSFLTEVYY